MFESKEQAGSFPFKGFPLCCPGPARRPAVRCHTAGHHRHPCGPLCAMDESRRAVRVIFGERQSREAPFLAGGPCEGAGQRPEARALVGGAPPAPPAQCASRVWQGANLSAVPRWTLVSPSPTTMAFRSAGRPALSSPSRRMARATPHRPNQQLLPAKQTGKHVLGTRPGRVVCWDGRHRSPRGRKGPKGGASTCSGDLKQVPATLAAKPRCLFPLVPAKVRHGPTTRASSACRTPRRLPAERVSAAGCLPQRARRGEPRRAPRSPASIMR